METESCKMQEVLEW